MRRTYNNGKTQKSEFAELIFNRMEKVRWSQRQLCEIAGITEESMSRVLSNKIKPSPEFAAKMCLAFVLTGEDAKEIHAAAARTFGYAV